MKLSSRQSSKVVDQDNKGDKYKQGGKGRRLLHTFDIDFYCAIICHWRK